MKINTTKKVTLLSGKDIPTEDGALTVGKAVANILSSTRKAGAMKLFVLAQKFYKDATVELDEADLKLVEAEIEKTEVYTTLVTGQLLLVFGELKEKKEDNKKVKK